MILPDLIAQASERFPDKTALVFPKEDICFADLNRAANQVAARLRKLGIGHGDRVAILYENALTAVVYFWGILKSGAQTVDSPCLAGVETIFAILEECKPRAVVISERQLRRFDEATLLARLPSTLLVGKPPEPGIHIAVHTLEDIRATEPCRELTACSRDFEVAMIVYTSGTTGEPKGVMLSHRNLMSNISAANTLMCLDSSHSILVVVPLHFIHGRMQLLTHALIGGTMAFSAGFHFPQQVVTELATHGVTGFSGVPYHFSSLLEITKFKSCYLPDLRYVLVTGGAMSPDALQRLSAALPGVDIHLAYGQTEASPRVTYLGPKDRAARTVSLGRPLPGVHVHVVSDTGEALHCEEIGEVVVSGANVMCGYVSGDEITSGKIDEFGRLHTGDIGRIDKDGYLYLVGRKSELIKSAGERVFPREIETILLTHPDILEAAVLGLPDELLGEKIVACVVPRAGVVLQLDAVRSHCLRFLPLVRIPREIRLSDALPKTSSGKVDRGGLAAHFDRIGRAKVQHV